MKMTSRDRRDWSLLIFIIPIGIFLMMIAGGIAVRVVPQWRLEISMASNLKVGDYAGGVRPALNPLILTPFSWFDTYLTPSGADVAFIPFVVVESSATPSSTPISSESPSPTSPSPTLTVTETPVATTDVPTQTNPDGGDGNGGGGNSGGGGAGNNNGGSGSTSTCDDPTATNYGQTGNCTFPPPTCTDPNASNQGQPLPCEYSTVSTPDASWRQDTTLPNNLEVGSDPNGTIAAITDGHYVVVGLSIVVGATPDNNYDLVYYESNNGGQVYMDWIIIGISLYNDGHEYYEVFNWGNGTPDDNSNVGDVAGSEDDNQPVALSELYDPDGGGPAPQTGILIDVDQAPSNPPAGIYNYVIIISPLGGSSGGDPAEVDAIDAVEVPIPPGGNQPIQNNVIEITEEPVPTDQPNQITPKDSNETIEESTPVDETNQPTQVDAVETAAPTP